MMYQFMTLDDKTEIVHSELLENGVVKVYVEKPDAKDGFHNAYCYLPSYEWKEINGFNKADIERYQEVIESVAHLIIEFAGEGGFEHASSF